jgi:ornithine cyclodeaminase/alanine dehydrogenase-like protein (mu-crystallin family)
MCTIFFLDRFYGVMPAFSKTEDALGTKLVSFYPNNTHIATHQAVIILNNASDGSIKAVSYTFTLLRLP